MEHKLGIAAAIKKKTDAAGISDRALALSTGIPATTLGRKMAQGGETLTVLELKLIANELGIGFMELIKDSA